MAYIGDSSLSSDIQSRVGTTFSHTIELAEAGKQAEALLGCDFILRLDPLFEPARTLQDRVKRSGSAPIETQDLRALVAVPEEEPAAARGDDSGDQLPADDRPGEVAADEVSTGEEEAFDLDEELDWIPTEEIEGQASPALEETVSDGSERINGLLADGQRALAEENYQEAIDAWSRIFLIDVGHEEAVRRIELAQRLKAEREREVEELYNEGDARLEAGETDTAMVAFSKVLKLQPDHLAAQERIEEIQSPPKGEPSEAEPEMLAGEDSSLDEIDGDWAPDESSAEENTLAVGTMMPPEDARPKSPAEVARETVSKAGLDEEPEIEEPVEAAPASSRPQKRFLVIGGTVLVLVVAGALLLNRNWSNWFPNADEEVVTESAAPPLDRMGRISLLRDGGEVERAIEALEKIRPNEADYERAQLLLAEWGADIEDIDVAVIDSADDGARQALIELARQSYAVGEYLPAARYFQSASALAALEGAEADLFEDSKRQLEPIASLVDLYSQREYDLALPSLWRFYQQHPENRDVQRLLVNSHYNLAIRSLRQGSVEQAKALIEEAVRLDPDDAYAQRLLLFAETYTEIGRDLLYEIFVSNLESRK